MGLQRPFTPDRVLQIGQRQEYANGPVILGDQHRLALRHVEELAEGVLGVGCGHGFHGVAQVAISAKITNLNAKLKLMLMLRLAVSRQKPSGRAACP
jgi:hypothetical protein